MGERAFGLAESEYVGAEKEMVAAYEIFANMKWLPNSQRKVSFLLSGELICLEFKMGFYLSAKRLRW